MFLILQAINPHGESFYEIELKEAREPGTLQQAVTDKVTATTIQFRFVAPHETGGLPIDSFAVEYKESTQMWDNAKRRVWPASKSQKVDFDAKKLILMQNLSLKQKVDFDAKSRF